MPLAEPEDDDVEVLVEDSGIICDEGLPDEQESNQEEIETEIRENRVHKESPEPGASSSEGTPKKRKEKGALEMKVESDLSLADVVNCDRAESSLPTEPTVVPMNGDLDIEQIMDVNGNGTGKSRKWFEQKIAELEELDKTSTVAVDGESSVSDRMTDLNGLVPGVEMVDFAEKYFNVHSATTGYTSAFSKTVSMVRRRSVSVSFHFRRKIPRIDPGNSVIRLLQRKSPD